MLTKSPWNSHLEPLFKNFNILSICEINQLQNSGFMYEIDRGLLPEQFGSISTPSSQIHDNNTRAKDYIHIHSH